MHIRYGYSLDIEDVSGGRVALLLDVHPEQRGDLTQPDEIAAVSIANDLVVDATHIALDANGNLTRRVDAPHGVFRIEGSGVIFHSGFAESSHPDDRSSAPPADPPAEVLPFLLPSRCCPGGELDDQARSLFRHLSRPWDQVRAICDHVERRLRPSPYEPLSFKTAGQVLEAGAGSMDDSAAVAIAFCRALSIPARYCRGYVPLTDGTASQSQKGFNAWFEAYLDGAWWTLDARHVDRQIGRILVARGADAADVPLAAGSPALRILRVQSYAEPVEGARYPATGQERRDHWQMLNTRTDS